MGLTLWTVIRQVDVQSMTLYLTVICTSDTEWYLTISRLNDGFIVDKRVLGMHKDCSVMIIFFQKCYVVLNNSIEHLEGIILVRLLPVKSTFSILHTRFTGKPCSESKFRRLSVLNF
jgi:hypothetical protein